MLAISTRKVQTMDFLGELAPWISQYVAPKEVWRGAKRCKDKYSAVFPDPKTDQRSNSNLENQNPEA